MIPVFYNKIPLNGALAVSLFLHVTVFGAITAMHSPLKPNTHKEYIPVELVQLPPSPYETARAPVAVAASPRTVKTPAASQPAPPTPPVIREIAAPPQTRNNAPVADQALPVRTTSMPVPGSGTPGKEQPGNAGSTAPSSPAGSGSGQPQKRDKGSYQAFHRLSRLPAFKVRKEPVYPPSERMTGNEARVMAEIYLDERGAVDDVVIKKSGGRLFDKAVLEAVRQSSFHPGYMGDKAMPTVIQMPFTFKLR
ncbi:MAG: hypothetical protein A2076_17380 [Geobacteraceae bacterium GWC2_53_11]|nr:MAG: hypothetical protein A2076_17380 [Geobacteraceae bacterium GWC2_53_11]